jgi:hypothetical protein
VTVGPLLEFSADGRPMGSRIRMGSGGGTVDFEWRVATVTMPATKVELIVNGTIAESVGVRGREASGVFRVPLKRSSWAALLVRGCYRDKPEIVAAHSSPVMIEVDGTPFFAEADAMTILAQIEGAIAYLDTMAVRGDPRRHKAMRLVLTSAHRSLHNRLHREGVFHGHGPLTDHPAHH